MTPEQNLTDALTGIAELRAAVDEATQRALTAEASSAAALAHVDVLTAEVARLQAIIDAGPDPDPDPDPDPEPEPDPFLVQYEGGDIVRGTWLPGADVTRVGRIGEPMYEGTQGWDTDLIGGVPQEWLDQGYVQFSEAAVGRPWTVFAELADGARIERQITPAEPVDPADIPVRLVDLGNTEGGEYQA